MICDVCQKQPAVYGDGVTWGRCSKCEYEFRKENKPEELKTEAEVAEESKTEGEGIPHKMVPGLISIIMPVYMVNYPLFHYTGTAIGSVRSHSKKGTYELIIVDNGSPIQPPNLQSYYAHKVIKWSENRGVSKAWNAGIRASFGEYIVLVNNDTQVYEGWLEGMKEALDNGLDLVMATPMYSLTEPFARWVESETIRDRWIGKPVTESFSDFKDFSCVMFKKSLMDEVGMFDEQFFNYAQDSDLFKRMDQAGKKYASTKMVAIHHIIDATGASIPETPELMNKDKAKFEEKWRGGGPKMEEQSITKEESTVESPVLGEVYEATYNLKKSGEDIVCAVCDEVNPTVKHLEDHKTPPAPKYALVRTNETGDKIFLLKDDQTHWIRNPETLKALGADFGQEKTLTKEEFSKFTKGEDLDMTTVEKYKDA